MDFTLGAILIATLAISAVSLLGLLYFVWQEKVFKKSLPYLVAFAAGSLLAVSWFDLIPDSFEAIGKSTSVFVLIGILIFLMFEQILHWHHEQRHDCGDCNKKTVGYAVLLGDSLHNFLDGIIIASAFLISVPMGISATLAVFFHEIPQELGDFAVLIHSGFKKEKALLYNFLSALVAVLGGILGYFFLRGVSVAVPYIVAIGAGGFLYIALVDLFAELKATKNLSTRVGQMVALLLGLVVLYVVTGLE
ncbi:ZIP family metal transporter [Patescibacteria group bacterium]|nr:ZIP family metal transporter [Patescibacteria group bacterium]